MQNRRAITGQEPNFLLLHDFTRHAIHSSEILDVAIDTVKHMLRQHEWFSHAGQSYIDIDVHALRCNEHDLSFQMQMLQNLRARSKANEERLRNEITLVRFEARRVDRNS